MKKILFTFILFLGCAVSVLADSTTDALRWNYQLSYHNATRTLAVGNWVYAVTNGNLLAYDSESGQTYTLDKLTPGLSDISIKSIAWSATQKCLIVLYANNNIDLVYPSGDGHFSVQNVPQIKNFEEDITITRLSAYGDWACFSTSQGVIVFDVKGQTVRSYYKVGEAVKDAFVKDGKVYASVRAKVIVGKLTDDLYNTSSWRDVITPVTVEQLLPVGNEVYITLSYYRDYYGVLTLGVARLQIDERDKGVVQMLATGSPQYDGTSNGNLVQFVTANSIIALSADNPDVVEYNITTDATLNGIARTTNGLTYIAQGYDGLQAYRIAPSATELPQSQGVIGNFGPRHTGSFSLLYDHNRLFVAGSQFSDGDVEGFFGCYNGTTWSDMDEDRARTEPGTEGRTGLLFKNTSHMAIDPSDPEHVFVASMLEGLYEYRNGKFVTLYNADNSPLQWPAVVGSASRNSNVRIGGCTFDKEGNLWLTNNFADTLITVLKPNGDWKRVSAYYNAGWEGAEGPFLDSRGYLWVKGRRWSNAIGSTGIMLLDYGGTLNNKNDDRSVYFSSANNEDGTSCELSEILALTEDKNGQIWFGCSTGVYSISNPDDCFKTNFTINQPKVPRNDGTDYADYLLTGTSVSAICVDAGNRKWLGTLGAGIYLVSEDGSEILQHFTSDNSPLLSDNIFDFAINPTNGRLYIATDKGLCSYEAGATEVQPTLNKSNLRIYPNPVRPDYRGVVTIAGLTENAEVKVLSTGSQLVARGTSVGGSWQWDVTQQNTGERVASGVYYIMVATADGKTSIAGKVIVI